MSEVLSNERPATVQPNFNWPVYGNDVATIAVGPDLVFYVGHRYDAEGKANDAGEEFRGAAFHVDAFDNDFNYLGCLGRFQYRQHAIAALPVLVDVARRTLGPWFYGAETWERMGGE